MTHSVKIFVITNYKPVGMSWVTLLPSDVVINCIFPCLNGSDILQFAYCSRLNLRYVHKHGFTPYKRFIKSLKELGLAHLPALLIAHNGQINNVTNDAFIWRMFESISHKRIDPIRNSFIKINNKYSF